MNWRATTPGVSALMIWHSLNPRVPTMTTAEHLHPVEMPRCDATRDTAYANDTDDTDKQCKHTARYRIDDHCFCTKHAGQAALQILLRECSIKGPKDT